MFESLGIALALVIVAFFSVIFMVGSLHRNDGRANQISSQSLATPAKSLADFVVEKAAKIAKPFRFQMNGISLGDDVFTQRRGKMNSIATVIGFHGNKFVVRRGNAILRRSPKNVRALLVEETLPELRVA